MKTKLVVAFILLLGFQTYAQSSDEQATSLKCGEEFYISPQQMPSPQLKKTAIEEFLETKVVVPELLKVSEIKFFLQHSIDCEGNSKNIYVLRSGYTSLDEPIMTCLHENITWNPGRQNTIPVNAIFKWEIMLKQGKFFIMNKL